MQDRNRKSLNPDFDKTYRSQVSQQMLFKNPSLLSASVWLENNILRVIYSKKNNIATWSPINIISEASKSFKKNLLKVNSE